MDAGLDITPGGLCEGCLRTLDEIAQWALANDAARRAILVEVAQRRLRLGLSEAP